MSRSTRQEPFLSLMQRFLDRHLEAEPFCAEFTKLWIQRRDALYEKEKAVWPEPYAEILIASFQRGEISDKQFREKYAKLWGSAEELEFQETIDAIHSACSVFAPDPEIEWEINEEQLRREVEDAFAVLTKLDTLLVQAA